MDRYPREEMPESPLPSFADASPPEFPAAGRGKFRVAAVVGALASALWCVAFFLPWIEIPGPERTRIRNALEPSIEALAEREPEHAERYRILMREVVDTGGLSGLDLYHYARTALELNRSLIGTDAKGHVLDRPWVVQRALRSAGFLLAALPVLAGLIALHLLANAFRRARSVVLATLVVLGLTGGAVAIAWLRFAESLATGMTTGTGLYLALGASVSMACAGLFGVTSKTWWRVYVLAVVTMGAIGFLAGRYVATGSLP